MPLLWSIFFFLVLVIFIIENYIYKKKEIKKQCLKNFCIHDFYWFFLSLLFFLIFWYVVFKNEGSDIANTKITLFSTGYLLEILLSIDNVFVWFLIFQSFKIPISFQKKVLSYGIWGAVVFRSIMIFYGKIFFSKWHWLLCLFGFFFLLTSLKFIFFSNKTNLNKKNIKISWIYNICRVSKDINSEKFFMIINNKFFITPLFVSLITIELSDIAFSVDSIPAIFSITNDFFIVFSSNIFSILGLRSMYFFVSIIIEKNSIIKYGLSVVLIFIGLKMIFEHFFVIPAFITFFIILIIIIITFIINSVLNYKKY
ncbi:MAG: TerC/Alx family metal homeostasis membrane protein [Buchnera aphidicola (Microlophium carnosum)]|uniref:TerC/Alx family metal homeostasis membrane protein n=1 Tax=Buchnera aphidicola (Microlophium carnosum) TaxID=2708354 RepID=A0A6G9JU95_9GAMM|nr:MAG: TerC/Alx family metal homeostasis membrane protein [Buchnera aphidicola (Microlophium carnosum)]